MCQLTFADFSEDYKFLSGYIPLLVLIDSLDNNPDGYGMNLNSEISKLFYGDIRRNTCEISEKC